MKVTVIGAGLAGSECAWQLAERGVEVTLREMKPEKKTPAHETAYFAELCCSNSLRAAGLENAVGLLKEELRRLGSLIIRCADATAVPAGGALAAQEAVTRFLVENFRSGSFAADPAQQHADGMPIDFGGNASGASVGLAAGAQPKVSGGDPLRPSSSPADGLSGREAGSGPSGLIF